MTQLTCIPGTPMGYPLPKVYLFCRPQLRQRHVDALAEAIRACRNCDIYWSEEPISAPMRRELLGDMKLFILPVDFTLLSNPNEDIEGDVAFALQEHIPLLPVLMEPEIYPVYSLPHKFGKLPCLRYCKSCCSQEGFLQQMRPGVAARSNLLPRLRPESRCGSRYYRHCCDRSV